VKKPSNKGVPKARRLTLGPSCFYCGDPAECADHKTPVSRGGTDALDNLAAACWRCNTDKKDMTVEEFRGWCAVTRGLLPAVFPGEGRPRIVRDVIVAVSSRDEAKRLVIHNFGLGKFKGAQPGRVAR
jgi:HNH endonuclease